MTIDQPCPSQTHLHRQSCQSNLYFLCWTATRLDSLSTRAPGCKFAIFLKASPSLCTPPDTNHPIILPSAELRAPVAVVPRTTGRQKFESTLIQPLHNTPCDFALQKLRPFCISVDLDLQYIRAVPVGYRPICRNILATATTETKLDRAHRQLFDSVFSWALGIYSYKFQN